MRCKRYIVAAPMIRPTGAAENVVGGGQFAFKLMSGREDVAQNTGSGIMFAK